MGRRRGGSLARVGALTVAAVIVGSCASGRTTHPPEEEAEPEPTPVLAPPAESTTTTATTTMPSSATAVPTGPATAAPVPDRPVLLAAGDIASCSSSGDEATAALLRAQPAATVITLGDNVYDKGSPAEFSRCYGPSWGDAARARTRPAPGNHDYGTSGASGYFGYFGPPAGDPTRGYYSYDVGAWHVVALNSNCSEVPCASGSAQERWLRADLAASPSRCTLAYWHHPRFSSGREHGSSMSVAPLWQALYDSGADLVLAGHEHNYERLGPLNPSGAADPARGLRSFVVGTGGASHYGFGRPIPGSEVRNGDTFGVLELVLKPTGYDWRFLPVAGKKFTDAGSASCH